MTGPSPRTGAVMAYDSARDRVVLFGGAVLSQTMGPMVLETFNDTGVGRQTWTEITVANPPPSRTGHMMTYDPIRKRVVMFGGGSNEAGGLDKLGDTWEWDGQTWTERTGPGPSGRGGAAMGFDPISGGIILFGGFINTGTPQATGDTWRLDAGRLDAAFACGLAGGTARSAARVRRSHRSVDPRGWKRQWKCHAHRCVYLDGHDVGSDERHASVHLLNFVLAHDPAGSVLAVVQTPSRQTRRSIPIG